MADCSIRGPVPFPRRKGLGGQRERIGISRAQAPGPHVLTADETVSAPAVLVQPQILNLFQDSR